MNPRLALLAPLPVRTPARAARATCGRSRGSRRGRGGGRIAVTHGVVPPGAAGALRQPLHRRAPASHAGVDPDGPEQRTGRPGQLSGHSGSPALREAIAGWIARRHQVTVDPATEVLPVNGSQGGAFRLRPDGCRSAAGGRGGGAQSVLPDLRRSGPAGRSAGSPGGPVARQRPALRLGRSAGGGLGSDAAGLRLLARQSDRCGHAAFGVAAAVRAVRSPWLRDRLRRVLLGNLPGRGRRRRSAALPPARSWAGRATSG